MKDIEIGVDMNNEQFNQIVNFLWSIPNEILRDYYVRGKYRDVILPMIVIRRLDAVLEPTKEKVLATKKKLDEQGFTNQEAFLCEAAGQAFYNDSPFLLRDLTSKPTVAKLKADFIAYLDGFSANVQEILSKFKFRNQIDTLVEADILGSLIEKFLDKSINLSIEDVKDKDGNVILPKLDNHAMGTVFEELIRKFNEENNEEAGEHFTPRDIVTLMADLAFEPVKDKLKDGTYLIYDGACGTGGMLTLAQERMLSIAKEQNKKFSISIYGQELQPETYAISKADLLLQGEGGSASNIAFGSTLSADGFNKMNFDFMLSNPPYGKNWKVCKDKMSDDKGVIKDSRFVINYNNNPEYSMVPSVDDGQLLFLMNNVSKMVSNTELGSRIVEVHNGSSLFTGDAGQGTTNARQYMFEQDLVEVIVALPLNMFYNTGIATYIWVLTNKKPEHKKGKVQLIDATSMYEPLKKNLGNKNCYLTEEHIKTITNLMIDFNENEYSKIFLNEEFGYNKICTERPLRLKVSINDNTMNEFKSICSENKAEKLYEFILENKEHFVAETNDYNEFKTVLNKLAKGKIKLANKDIKLIRQAFCTVDEEAKEVISKKNKDGSYEYEKDPDLSDTEQIPLLYEGGIEEYFKKEVLPYAPDAWIEKDKTKIGYELSFTKYFYKPTELRSLEEIETEISDIEKEAQELLQGVFC